MHQARTLYIRACAHRMNPAAAALAMAMSSVSVVCEILVSIVDFSKILLSQALLCCVNSQVCSSLLLRRYSPPDWVRTKSTRVVFSKFYIRSNSIWQRMTVLASLSINTVIRRTCMN